MSDNKSKGNENSALMEWKKSYMEALINELHPSGNVLEVGFGFGHAATRIQSFHPKSHTIIESNPQIAEKARQWATKYKNITIIQDSWKNALPKLGKYDSIFFNDYPMDSVVEDVKTLSEEETVQVTNKAKNLLGELKAQLSKITTKFSDQDIDEFYKKVGQSNLKELPSFFSTLKNNGNITDKQYKEAVKKYSLEKDHAKNAVTDTKQPDIMLDFLKECIAKHMQMGCRFSSFLTSSISKFEDSLFFDCIITNPEFDYHEQLTSIDVLNSTPIESLIIVIEKKS